MGFGTLKHGDTRLRTFKVPGQEIKRREIYCEIHGWVDLFFIGDEEGFKQKHGLCDQKPGNGAAVSEVKVMRASA